MKRVIWLCALCLGLAIASALPAGVSAHAYVDQSSPQQEAQLQEAPTEIRLTFTEEINEKVSSLVLKTEAGNVISDSFRAEGKKTLVMPISSLEKGIYRVEWQVLSVDTHVTEGSYRFAVGVALPKIRPAETVSLDEVPAASSAPPLSTASDSQATAGQGTGAAGGQKASEMAGTSAPPAGSSGSNAAGSAQPTSSGEQQGRSPTREKADAAKDATKDATDSTASAAATKSSASTTAPVTGSSPDDNSRKPGSADTPASSQNQQATSEDPSSTAPAQSSSPEGQTAPDQEPHVPSEDASAAETTLHPADVADAEIVAEKFVPATAHDHKRHEQWNKALRIGDVLAAAVIGILVFLSRWSGFVSAIPTPYRKRLAGIVQLFLLGAVLCFTVSGGIRIYLLADMLRLAGGVGENILMILWHTSTGTIGWVRPLLGLLLIMAFRAAWKSSASPGSPAVAWPGRAAAGLTLALFGTFPLTGHAMAGQERLTSVVSDVLHMTAAVVWIGGLSGLVVLSFRLAVNAEGLAFMHKLMSQFAQLALYAVAIITGTGLVLGLLRFSQPGELVTTSYGLLLLAKLLAFGIALLIAGYHRARVMPRLASLSSLQERDASRMAKTLAWTLRIELLVVLAAILLAGLLSATPPPIIR